MTEQEWLECDDPRPMLGFLENRAFSQGKDEARRVRLFAVACCRRIWHYFTDDRSRKAVELAERMADEQVADEEHSAIYDAAFEACEDAFAARLAAEQQGPTESPEVERLIRVYHAAEMGEWILGDAWDAAEEANWLEWDWAQGDEPKFPLALLRDIFGNPFRPVSIDPSWLTWNDGTIPKLAQSIYTERRFEDMPILADALEERAAPEKRFSTTAAMTKSMCAVAG